jgi:hypothetical protein
MKQHILLVVIALFVAMSCDEDTDSTAACSVENPTEDLDWLAAEIENMKQSGMSEYLWVSQAKYGFQTVFIFGNCCPNCLTIVPVYNCSGEHLGNVGDQNFDPGILDDDVIIWKSFFSSCHFE